MTTYHWLLVLATLVLLSAGVVPRLFPRWQLWERAAFRIAVLVALTLLAQRIFGSPFHPHFNAAPAGEQLWEQIIAAGWWVLGARSAVGLARLLVVLEGRPRETQIVSDLMAGAIYVATLLAVVDFAFEVPVGGLVATSGVIAIVLGLALQSTLSDVFSGIAVGIERPYKAGDLIWVEGGIEGRVLQVNWRSTQIATFKNDIAVVPNSIIAKSRLVNHSLPTTIRRDTVAIRLDARVMPEHAQAVLVAATRACRLPLETPPISVALVGLQGDGAAWEISYSVASGDRLEPARTEMFGLIQRHLRHDGIALAVAGRASVPRVAVPTPAELLEHSDLFGVIVPAERDLLAQHLTEIWLKPGDTLIRQDAAPDALFIVASGTVEITRGTGEATRLVYRMSPGGSLGAIGLITGAPYAATAIALTPVRAYRLDAHAIAAAIVTSPDLATALEALAERGQAALGSDVVAHEDQRDEPEMFLSRLRGFLHKLTVDRV